MPASYIGGKVPKLIVWDVFRNNSRYSCAKKISERVGLDPASYYVEGECRYHWTIVTSMQYWIRRTTADILP